MEQLDIQTSTIEIVTFKQIETTHRALFLFDYMLIAIIAGLA